MGSMSSLGGGSKTLSEFTKLWDDTVTKMS
jgi:hypothetical protein